MDHLISGVLGSSLSSKRGGKYESQLEASYRPKTADTRYKVVIMDNLVIGGENCQIMALLCGGCFGPCGKCYRRPQYLGRITEGLFKGITVKLIFIKLHINHGNI